VKDKDVEPTVANVCVMYLTPFDGTKFVLVAAPEVAARVTTGTYTVIVELTIVSALSTATFKLCEVLSVHNLF